MRKYGVNVPSFCTSAIHEEYSSTNSALFKRGTFLRWLRKKNGILGLWGAGLGLLFGATGILLNHRNVMKLPLAQYEKSNIELQLPAAGLLQLKDAETQKVKWIDSDDAVVRHNYSQYFFEQTDICSKYFKKAGADLLHIKTDDDYVKILQKFFLKRK